MRRKECNFASTKKRRRPRHRPLPRQRVCRNRSPSARVRLIMQDSEFLKARSPAHMQELVLSTRGL